jgi:hypothetical protein
VSRLPRVLAQVPSLIVLFAAIYAEFIWLGVVPSPWGVQ